MKQPNIHLTGQVAVVTGGGGGIGRAIALAYASVGARHSDPGGWWIVGVERLGA